MSSPPYTVIGTPFSTFTRTITLGLQYKGLKYDQVRVLPRADKAYEHHPFGFLPTLVIHEIDGKRVDYNLRESHAIIRYIDRVVPEPSLHFKPSEGESLLEERMWEVASLVAFLGFPAVEIGVVKPRVAADDAGKLTDTETREKVKDGVAELKSYLATIESLISPDGFAFGDNPTWADFYLYPLLADLRATPEGEIIGDRFKGWFEKMDALDAVKNTHEGTLATGARPP